MNKEKQDLFLELLENYFKKEGVKKGVGTGFLFPHLLFNYCAKEAKLDFRRTNCKKVAAQVFLNCLDDWNIEISDLGREQFQKIACSCKKPKKCRNQDQVEDLALAKLLENSQKNKGFDGAISV